MPATVIRTAIIYLVVTMAIRLMGKRQIGDMQPNELVITLLISEIAAIPLQDSNQPVLNGVAAISVLVVFEITVSTLSLKLPFLRKLLSGKAVILIKDGKIDQKAMKSVRVTVEDLLEMARSKDVFDLDEIAFAILEVNGELNILTKSEYSPVVKKDLNINNTPAYPLLPVIIDGNTVKENAELLGIDEKELMNIERKSGIKRDKIFILLYDKSGKYEITKKEQRP